MSDVLTVLLESLAEDFDIEVVERTDTGASERVCIDLRVSEQQLQAARSKVIAARALLPISEREALASFDTEPSER